MAQPRLPFWATPTDQELRQLETTPRGLSSAAAQQRLARSRPNRLTPRRHANARVMLLAQFKSPIMVLLLFATALSFALGEQTDAIIILIILLASGLLGFTPLPPTFLALLAGIIALYVLTAELAKKLFYQHVAW